MSAPSHNFVGLYLRN